MYLDLEVSCEISVEVEIDQPKIGLASSDHSSPERQSAR